MTHTIQVKTSDLLTEYKSLTKDHSTVNVTRGKLRMQHYYTFLSSQANNYAIEKTRYGVTKSEQRGYLLYPDYIKLKNMRMKDEGEQWRPINIVKNIDTWQNMTILTQNSNLCTDAMLFNNDGNMHFELDPIPTIDGDIEDPNLEIVYEGHLDPLSFPDDYNAGTVSVTQGSATITGSGTTFTSDMIGLFIQLGKWLYEIVSVSSTTQLQIVNYYQDSDLSGSSYAIVEISRLPAEFHYAPLWGAVWDFWLPLDMNLAKQYEKKYLTELALLEARYQNKTKGSVTQGRPVGVHHSRVPFNYPTRSLEL